MLLKEKSKNPIMSVEFSYNGVKDKKYLNLDEELYDKVNEGKRKLSEDIFYDRRTKEYVYVYKDDVYRVSQEEVDFYKKVFKVSKVESLLINLARKGGLNGEKDYSFEEVFNELTTKEDFTKYLTTNVKHSKDVYKREIQEVDDYFKTVNRLVGEPLTVKGKARDTKLKNNFKNALKVVFKSEDYDAVIEDVEGYINKITDKVMGSYGIKEEYYEDIRKLVTYLNIGTLYSFSTSRYNSVPKEINKVVKKYNNVFFKQNEIYMRPEESKSNFDFKNNKIKNFINKLRGVYLNREITKTYIKDNILSNKKRGRRITVSGMVEEGVVDIGYVEDMSWQFLGIVLKDYAEYLNKKHGEGFINLDGIKPRKENRVISVDFREGSLKYISVDVDRDVLRMELKEGFIKDYKTAQMKSNESKEDVVKNIKEGRLVIPNDRDPNTVYRMNVDSILGVNARGMIESIIRHSNNVSNSGKDYSVEVGNLINTWGKFLSGMNHWIDTGIGLGNELEGYSSIIKRIPSKMIHGESYRKDFTFNVTGVGRELYDKIRKGFYDSTEDELIALLNKSDELMETVNKLYMKLYYIVEKVTKYSATQEYKDIVYKALVNKGVTQVYRKHDVERDRVTVEENEDRIEDICGSVVNYYNKKIGILEGLIADLDGIYDNIMSVVTINAEIPTKGDNKEFKKYFGSNIAEYMGYKRVGREFKNKAKLRDNLIERGLLGYLSQRSVRVDMATLVRMCEGIRPLTDTEKFKIMDYILGDCVERQCLNPMNAITEYMDYVRMFKSLVEEGLRFAEDFKTKPYSLKLEHDIVMADYRKVKDIIDKKKFQNSYKKHDNVGFNGITIKDSDEEFVLVQPDSSEDLVEEGNQLNHCVGSYGRLIIEGGSLIYFLRRKGEEDKSYCTVELKVRGDSYVVSQMRTKHNKDMSSTKLKKELDKVIFEINSNASKREERKAS